ncbi:MULTISPECIES: rod shape-determining protein MreB [Desulfosporosinus]|uniref:Cell shape-determining protein MreB n=1 Tax=Desulfosporosinus nitroreducens TaxID=2018668 RepID=A0ABT8QN31_9FIRM|nr:MULTISPECIES: rod shape-determining protein MreB [Desulfosporosinus]MCO1601533.1 rod shape-determining protein MreB [Desulfosporosinus nitroreducens]MDA8220491.1 rod shape-determining protein MreB [Desulfitobacterium hafniense]MDO0822029.1 rod shape-determining protein MreB [Desulfosporosinus nitroreducens]
MLGIDFGIDLGIDLGTASVLVYAKGKGIVLHEPSVIAIDRNTNKRIAVGEEARLMIGRTPGNIVAVRPMRDGVIADYQTTELMLKYFLEKAGAKRWPFFKTRVVVCIPSGVTEVEQRAVKQAAYQAGAKDVKVVEEPYAAALGAGLDISGPAGSMVVDIGGGTTDIAVLSLNGIVAKRSLRVGGDKFDEAISRYIRREHNLMIGERTAEEIKIAVGSAVSEGRPSAYIDVRGRDLITGLPKTINVNSQECFVALEESIDAIVAGVKEVLERTPPELSSDILDKGIIMTGGGAMMYGFDTRLSRETGLPVSLAEDPISCVALGTGKVLTGKY